MSTFKKKKENSEEIQLLLLNEDEDELNDEDNDNDEDDDDEEEEEEAEKKSRTVVRRRPSMVDDDEDEEEEEEDEDEEENEEDEEEEENGEGKGNDAEAAASQLALGIDLDSDDESVDVEDDDAAKYKKLDSTVRSKFIADYHPELWMENNEEVEARTHILRDTEGRIVDPRHRTLPLLTKYERARILGERAKQINAGAKPSVDVPSTVMDGYLIALEELRAKKIPFIIKRPLPNGACEYWKLKDLEILI
jgi:DNA-directed RNA polymerase subunit K/omega